MAEPVWNAQNLASKIEHTLLRPEATADHLDALCDEAVEYRFFGVCVHPVFVKRAGETSSGISHNLTQLSPRSGKLCGELRLSTL